MYKKPPPRHPLLPLGLPCSPVLCRGLSPIKRLKPVPVPCRDLSPIKRHKPVPVPCTGLSPIKRLKPVPVPCRGLSPFKRLKRRVRTDHGDYAHLVQGSDVTGSIGNPWDHLLCWGVMLRLVEGADSRGNDLLLSSAIQ